MARERSLSGFCAKDIIAEMGIHWKKKNI